MSRDASFELAMAEAGEGYAAQKLRFLVEWERLEFERVLSLLRHPDRIQLWVDPPPRLAAMDKAKVRAPLPDRLDHDDRPSGPQDDAHGPSDPRPA